MHKKSPLVARKSSPSVDSTSPKISPRGSKEDHLKPSRFSDDKPKSNPGSGKASPQIPHKTTSSMANPSGSLNRPEILKSWEVRGLKEVVWKRAHGKVSLAPNCTLLNPPRLFRLVFTLAALEDRSRSYPTQHHQRLRVRCARPASRL